MYTTDSPYGYWITKDEIFPVVDSCAHYYVALDILSKMFNVSPERICEKYDPYRFMFKLGFVRVVNHGSGHSVEYRHDTKLSKIQKQYVKEASYVDEINYQRWTVRSK